jgi:glycosyltransferase involved in cell wall biosynthesis
MPPIFRETAGALPVATVYWGRFGAGAALMREISQALARDERFDLYASPSLQSEAPLDMPQARLLPIATFSNPAMLLARSIRLNAIIRDFVRRLSMARVRAIVTIMPHVWGLALQREARLAGVATILIVHDADPHPGERRLIFDRLVRWETRGSDHIVTLSRHVADRLLARGDVVESRLTRLYHPVLRFGPPAQGGPSVPFRLVFFGRILPYKGVGMLLEAFSVVRARGIDCTLRIVGRGRIDAPDHLKAQPGLTIDEGWVAPDAIADVLRSADAIVLPYLEASQSGVVAAAYGAGAPVVATPVGGLVEQVLPGETGVLSNGVTAEDFARAAARLIRTPGLYAACQGGVARYAALHRPEDFVKTLGDAIVAAIARKTAG